VSTATLPASLIDNPQLGRWIQIGGERTIQVQTGKVEIGQGILTALAQIAAEELDLPLDEVTLCSGETASGPDERYTTSSLSIEVSGGSIRLACAEFRRRVLDRAAQRLNCDREELSLDAGTVRQSGQLTDFDYWTLGAEIDWSAPISGTAPLKPRGDYRLVGSSVPRSDLPAKLGGGAFIHDASWPDMVHARVLRQPQPKAMLEQLDEPKIRRRSGDPELVIIRRGNFVAFASRDETSVNRAIEAAVESCQWSGLSPIAPEASNAEWLTRQPSKDQLIGEARATDLGGETHEATFTRPYVAHASIAPSCAIAQFRNEHLEIWSHGQGMHPLRRTIADALAIDPDHITAHHLHGAGCYGHNGADDAALDAAIIAREMPGESVRVMWRREDEFGYEPVGPAMSVTLSVAVDESGRPRDWNTEIWSGVHVQRPGLGGGNLLAHEALENPPPAPDVADPPLARGGGAIRNAIPLYDVGAHRTLHHLVPTTPVRTSALRGLGALPNVFAIDSMLDMLAAANGTDPIAYRLAIQRDPRAARTIESVAEMARWSQSIGSMPRGSGSGMGIGFAKYKNHAAYAAVIARVDVDESIKVTNVWCAADAGLVVNPDGALNQLEGGIIQGMSWTLKEQVRFGNYGIESTNWDSYPILRFSEVPEIEAALLPDDGEPSLGVGECSVGPTAAALGNALTHALGVRIFDLPLTRERIMQALL
jgi:CO/xanthine dehydrogenase Mo-binding subunit